MPDGLVGDAVFLGQIALGRQTVGDLTDFDAHLNIVRDLHVREVVGQRIDRGRTHMIKVCTTESCLNSC